MRNTSVNKKTLLFIVPLPPPYAGPEVSSELLLNSGLKERFRLVWLRSNVHKSNDRKGMVTPRSVLKLFLLLLRMGLLIIRHRPSAVYAILSQNTTGFIRDSAIVLTAKLFARKMVLHFRGSTFHNFYGSKNTVFRAYIRFILRRSDLIILQAHWVKEGFFSSILPAERLCVIYNAVPDYISAGLKGKSASADGAITVLFLNHLSVAKGALVLLEAIKEVIGKTNKIRFVIAGDTINQERNIFCGEDGKQIVFDDVEEALQKLMSIPQASQLVTLAGEVRGKKEKLELLASADIFVLPSYSEGCPMSVLEAMAAGLALVVTPVGALREIVKEGENGLFVESGDGRELAEKILFLASNRQLLSLMGQKNASLASSEFSLERIVNQLCEQLERL